MMNYTGKNAFPATGALINGPDCDGGVRNHQPRSESYNTVSAVNNAGFQALIAGLL